MKADFSRLRRNPEVLEEWLQQQGRVWLDSDWNESALARLRQLEAKITDIVGVSGRPEPGTAFRIGALPAPSGGPPGPTEPGDFLIGGGSGSAGHAYVAGILAANPQPSTYFTQQELPHPPSLPLPSVAITGWQLVGDLATARANHAAALVSATPGMRSVLVCGGSAAGVPTSSAERYDPAAATWSTRPSMVIPRLGHTATTLADGRVLVSGGTGGAGLTFASAELYDPVGDAWALTATMSSARTLHTATLLPDGRVLVCGGFGQRSGSLPSVPASTDQTLATAEIYDPRTGLWSSVPSMVAARADHRAAMVPASSNAGSAGGGVLVAGGQNGGSALVAAELYDPVANSWSSVGSMASAREAHALCVLSDGRVLAAGGTSAGVVLTSCEVFTPAAGTWRPAAAMTGGRANHTASPISGDQVLVAGGYSQGQPLSSAELYDAARDTWRAARSLNEGRAAHSGCVLDDGSVLVAGGTSTPGQPPAVPAPGGSNEIPTAELYHPASTSSALAYLEVWRRLMTYLQDDQREIALGGPDTTVRARSIAQVRVLQIPDSHQPDSLDCTHAAAYLPDDGAGRLSTLTAASDPPANACALSDVGVFSGGQNLLYRIEIHDSGQMLGAPAPAPLDLVADVVAGATSLQVGPISADQAAALTVGRWDLVSGTGPASLGEALDIDSADPSGAVTLRVGVRNSTQLSAGGAALTRRRLTVPLTAAAAAAAQSVRVDPDVGQYLVGSAAGALAGPTWFLRSGGAYEQVEVSGLDLTTGDVTLGGPLQNAYPAGAELVVRARYKWSADNASFATAVTAVLSSDQSGGTTTLQVASLGRDATSQLHSGDVVELIGDTDDLGRGVGLLAHVITEPDPDDLTLTVDVADQHVLPSDGAAILADHLVLRRWDGVGYVGEDPVDLGQGVQIQFSGYDFTASSYWWFTARAQTGSVDELVAAAPNGIERDRMPIALLRWSGDDETGVILDRITDCVPIFDPLSALEAEHIGYDDATTQLGASTVQGAIEALAPHTYPRVSAAGLSWSNDQELSIAAFNQGLTVRFTEPLNPATVTKQTFRVRIHVPDEGSSLIRVMEVPGTVSHELLPIFEWFNRESRRLGAILPIRPPTRFAQGVVAATFRPDPAFDPVQVGQWLNRLRATDPGAGVRVDVGLQGDKILDWTGAHALDGNVMARLGYNGYSTFTDLRLPSGDGREGGDFESWLFLAAPAVPAQVAVIDPAAGSIIDAAPQAIQVMFTKDVAATSVTPLSVVVRDPAGAPVSGSIDPFPFSPGAVTFSGLTFTPAVPGALAAPGSYVVILYGTGANPILDTDGMALDGLGQGVASDYTISFTVVSSTVISS
jgi:N-acetylneuraminic acid mutarotase